MNNRKTLRYASVLAVGGAVAAMVLSTGCSAVSSVESALSDGGLASQTECNEFAGGASSVAALTIDSDTKAFVTAGSNLVTIAGSMETAVLTSCKNIATSLGVTDTWTAKGPTMGGSLDAEVTEACNQASAAITAALNGGDSGVSAQGECGLSVSGGQCTVSGQAEATCEGSCQGSANCTPPDVTANCAPGSLSVTCGAMCQVGATCEGSVSAAASCQGQCSADCSGECDGTASATVQCNGSCSGNCSGTCDGTATAGGAAGAQCKGVCKGQCDAACMVTAGATVHCSGSCKGTCTGNCKVTATGGISCGAMATCRGGCSGMATAPKCEGTLKAPMCNASANCQASCQSSAEVQAMCTPPAVTLECAGSVSGQLQTLATAVQANMPAIIEAVQTQGPLVGQGVASLVATGKTLLANTGGLTVKAIACATTAAEAAGTASVSVMVTVSASASVSTAAGSPAMM